MTLWGDEAYSLNGAAKAGGEILAADPQLQRHPELGQLQQQQRQQLSEAVRLN